MNCSRFLRAFWVATGLLLCGTALRAQTIWYVDDNAPNDPGPGDPTISDPLEDGSPDHPFDAIQKAVNVAASSDVVLVLDGTYTGTGNRNVDFGGRLITVRSANGPDSCAIDCQSGQYHAFYFHNGETAGAAIEGLTMRNTMYTAALQIANPSAPTVRNCVFRGNSGLSGPGAAYLAGGINSTTLFEHCRFIGNSGQSIRGGAAYAYYSRVAFVECEFSGNHTHILGGAVAVEGGEVSFVNCSFVGNSADQYGGGVHINGNSAQVDFVNCVLVGNRAGNLGGGIASTQVGQYVFLVNLYNCTFAGNGAVLGRSIAHEYSTQGSGDYMSWNCVYWDGPVGSQGEGVYFGNGIFGFWYSDVFGGFGMEGDIDADPKFVQAPDPGPDGEWGTGDDDHGNLRLQAGSPCIDAANTTELPADVYDLDGDGDTTEAIPDDLDGLPRLVDDPMTEDTGVGFPCVDMGPYEFQPTSGIPGDDGAGVISNAPEILAVAPNPFDSRTTIWVEVPSAGTIRLAVYDLRGRLVRRLASGVMEAGGHPVIWDRRDERNRKMPSGVYLVRLERADGSSRALKLILTE